MAILRQLHRSNELRENSVTIWFVWRRFHVLTRIEVFVVSSLSAAIIATPFTMASISRNETAILHDLFWPDQFGPLIIFSSVFLALLPIFLAYYNLGRIGALLSLAVSAIMFYGGIVCAILVFRFVPSQVAAFAYAGVCGFFYLAIFILHRKATVSRRIRDAQRVLRLSEYDHTS